MKRYVSDDHLTESSIGGWVLYCEYETALRKLQAKIEALEAENSDLKSKIKELCPTPSPEFEATCQSIIKALEAVE